MNLFCLPFAGGSSISYRAMYTYLESFITPCFLEIPGHGTRAREPLLRDITAIVEACFDSFCRMNGGESFAFYGHSMGAIIGLLLMRKILDSNMLPPEHMFVSGRQGPAIPDKTQGRHLLPRDEFFSMLKDFEGSPREVLANQELMEYFEPILRADFQACESYNYTKAQPIPVPMTVMYGEREPHSYDEFLAWQHETSHPLRITSFSGGHFFIYDHFDEIADMISTTLRQCVSA